jgi:hypothetical protein
MKIRFGAYFLDNLPSGLILLTFFLVAMFLVFFPLVLFLFLIWLLILISGNISKNKNHRNWLLYYMTLSFSVVLAIKYCPKIPSSLVALYPIIIMLILHFIYYRTNFLYKIPPSNTRHFVILEAAGKRVLKAQDGFVDRPYPIGKTGLSKEELVTLANALDKMFIGYSIIEKDKVILIISGGLYNLIPFIKPNLQKLTYIEFDYSGNMSVHIAKKDYEKYKEELTFDQLCKALGDLILKFFALYKEGKEEEIVKMLKSANL